MITGETKPFFDEQQQAARRARNTYRIGLWNGILFTLIAIASTISTIQTGLYVFGGIALAIVVAAVSFVAANLAQKGKAPLGSALLVGTILASSFTLPIIAKGQGIALAFLIVVIVSSISYLTLTSRWTIYATLASILIGFLTIIADFFLPDFGIPNDPQFTYVISAIAGSIYLLALIRRFRDFSLRAKIIASFLAITLLLIFGLSVYTNTVTRDILTQQAESTLSTLAIETGQRIDQFILSQFDIIKMEAQQPLLAQFLQQSLFSRNEELESAAIKTLLTFVRKNPVFIQSYALLDMSGKVVLSTNPAQIGTSDAQTEYFRLAVLKQEPQLSSIANLPDEPVLYFISPIRAESGLIVGMLRAEYNAVILEYLVNTPSVQRESGQRTILIESSTLIKLADTQQFDTIYHPFPEISTLLPDLSTPTTLMAPGKQRGQGLFLVSLPLSTNPWVVIASQPENTIYAQADRQARTLVLFSIALTAFALLVALLTAQFISRPIASLVAVAQKIILGDLHARSDINTDDEVGKLGRVFNQMTAQLSQTLASLEQRIQERTAQLQATSQQSEQRARQLQSIADISKIITREQNLEKLLPLIAETVSERFGYYHVGIFLLDETRRTAVLQASNSPGGQKMLASGHKLSLGTSSIVGYAALTGKPRIALDVGEDAVFFNNPHLPETRSEMALPLVVRSVVIGVLDMQSKQANAFTQEDIEILSILADQVAIAIENARLFAQNQAALQETQAIVQSFVRQEWAALTSRQTTIGYLHTNLGGQSLTSPIQLEEIEQALRKGNIIKKESKTTPNANPVLVVPLKIGEQLVGAIRIQAPNPQHSWSTEEINLVRSIADRVGLALDNARLVASSQRRAAKERAIGEISAKISAATDMDAILKTAAQEIGRVLSEADVVIQLKQFEDE
ncbi:MAG: hypothetical protein DDG60_12025 [Anaerolineae bacterium]|nr:MAG: hypothetical protein DDG60_12025 [Anaerolineae bacterium]